MFVPVLVIGDGFGAVSRSSPSCNFTALEFALLPNDPCMNIKFLNPKEYVKHRSDVHADQTIYAQAALLESSIHTAFSCNISAVDRFCGYY